MQDGPRSVPIPVSLDERAKIIGEYMVKNNSTIREVAKRYNLHNGTVYYDLTERLPEVDHKLYLRVQELLAKNKAERHIRGGNATHNKYSSKNK